MALRKALLLPLDDLLAVVREFLNPHVSRSGLDRCLRRHGVGNLQALKPKEPKPAHGSFKAYEPGYLHIDIKYLPQMADEDRRRYLFVAIDRATRWVFVRIYPAQTAANARRFLRDLERAAPMKITRVLTDNGKAFTDRLFGLRKRAATGQHEFDLLCAELGIEHRLTPPMRPQTNGMVERFNGRIEDVLQSHRFQSGEDLQQTLLRYVHLYNSQLPQSALKGRTPINALKDWQRQKPELFRKRVYNHMGCDKYIPHDTPLFIDQRGSTGGHHRRQLPEDEGGGGAPRPGWGGAGRSLHEARRSAWAMGDDAAFGARRRNRTTWLDSSGSKQDQRMADGALLNSCSILSCLRVP